MATIAELNDQLRRKAGLPEMIGGRVMMSRGVSMLPRETREAIFAKVRRFSKFTDANDPYKEHDFGVVYLQRGRPGNADKIYWKIDYYDKAMEYSSENPADPEVTTRVLTIMLATEY